MRKHEILKGVPKLVAMLALNFKATLSYSIIENLCNFVWYFLIERIFTHVYISRSKLRFYHVTLNVFAIRYSFVGKSRFVKEIFQIYLHIQTCHVYHFLNCPIHMFMFSSWQRISAHEHAVDVVVIIVCIVILFSRTCYTRKFNEI